MATAAQPNIAIPPGHLEGFRDLPSIILHASLWRANGEVKQDTATFTSPDSKFGNSNGTLVPEGVTQDGLQGTGSASCEPASALLAPSTRRSSLGRLIPTRTATSSRPTRPLIPRPPRPLRSL